MQQQRGIGRQVVEQRCRRVEEQRQEVFDAGGQDAVGDILVKPDARGVALEAFAEALAEHRAPGLTGGELARRQQADFWYRIQGALAIDVEAADGLDLVVEEFDAVGQLRAHREQVDQAAAHAVFAGGNHLGHVLVAGEGQLAAQGIEPEALALFHEEGVAEQEGGRRQTRDGRRGGDDQQLAFLARDGVQGGEPLRDQVLVWREGVVGQGLPIRQQVGTQFRREPGDFLGEALCLQRAGADRHQQAAAMREPGQRQGIGGRREGRQVEALARFGRRG
jgi:hypothetical protein